MTTPKKDRTLLVSVVLLVLSIAAIVAAFTMNGCASLDVEAEKSFEVNVKTDPCNFEVIIDGTRRFHGWSETVKCVFNIKTKGAP